MAKSKKKDSALRFPKPAVLRKDADFVDSIKGERYNFKKNQDGSYNVTHAVINNSGWIYVVKQNENQDWKIVSALPQDKSLEKLFVSRIIRHELQLQLRKR